MTRHIILAAALLTATFALSACVVAPAPGYGRPGCFWVAGHYGPYGRWVPAHCR